MHSQSTTAPGREPGPDTITQPPIAHATAAPAASTSAAPAAFELSEIESVDSAWINVNHPKTGLPTPWRMELAGPGHPATLAIQKEAHRDRLALDRRIENARVNGKKYKADEVDVEADRRQTAERLARRIIGWTPLTVDGKAFEYSPANALVLMTEPRWSRVFEQLVEYLSGEAAFTKGSATT